jgi:segregation and condensation protein B
MNEQYLKNVIEAALLAAGKPLSPEDLIALFDEARRPSKDDIRAALAALAADYAERGIELKETATGFRIQVRRELAEEVSRLWPERPARYSRALLETLALIAYRQPITRGEIEAVRGVAVNPNIVKTLLERNWIRVIGQRDVPGRPELLGTTREFLDYFGLKSLEDLPPLAELKVMADLNVQLDFAATSAAASPQGAASATDPPQSADGEPTDAGECVSAARTGESAPSPQTAGLPDAAREADVSTDELDAAADDELEDEEESGEDPEASRGLVAASTTSA